MGKFLVVPGLQPCEIAWRAEEGVFLLFQGELLLVLEAELLNRFVGCGELGVGGLLFGEQLRAIVLEIGEELPLPHLRAGGHEQFLRIVEMADRHGDDATRCAS